MREGKLPEKLTGTPLQERRGVLEILIAIILIDCGVIAVLMNTICKK